MLIFDNKALELITILLMCAQAGRVQLFSDKNSRGSKEKSWGSLIYLSRYLQMFADVF